MYSPRWVKLSTANLLNLATLSHSALVVFFALIQKTRYGGHVFVKTKTLTTMTKLSQRSVFRALKTLASIGVFEKLGQSHYRFNNDYVYVGGRTKAEIKRFPGLTDCSTGKVKRFKVNDR